MQPQTRFDGLVIVGHGTRDQAGLDEFLRLVELVRRSAPAVAVEPAFLEFAEPSIPDAIATLVAGGARRVEVLPLLLFAAGHAKEDIPAEVARAAERHPEVELNLTQYLGCHQALIELSVLRGREALERADASTSADTLLLMIGRGSHDPTANAEMCQFARLRYEAAPCGRLDVAFTAMTKPSLNEGLEVASQLRFRKVLVQPHLLFQGELLARVREAVGKVAQKKSDKEWVCADHLGAHPLLARAVLDRAGIGSER